jgi:hypothetical protein
MAGERRQLVSCSGFLCARRRRACPRTVPQPRRNRGSDPNQQARRRRWQRSHSTGARMRRRCQPWTTGAAPVTRGTHLLTWCSAVCHAESAIECKRLSVSVATAILCRGGKAVGVTLPRWRFRQLAAAGASIPFFLCI